MALALVLVSIGSGWHWSWLTCFGPGRLVGFGLGWLLQAGFLLGSAGLALGWVGYGWSELFAGLAWLVLVAVSHMVYAPSLGSFSSNSLMYRCLQSLHGISYTRFFFSGRIQLSHVQGTVSVSWKT